MTDPRPRWHHIHQDLPREHGHEPLRIEGEVPPGLRGTLYRNGPARFRVGEEPYVHSFDGDGAITAVRLGQGPPTGASRLLRTSWLQEEEAAKRHLYRSYAQLGVGWRRWLAPPKNQANVAVLAWRGQTWALWEFGHPVRFDPDNLDCIGPENIDGQIGSAFGAHPHVVRDRAGDTVFQTGLRFGPNFSLDLFELGDRLRKIGNVPLPFPTLIHDFAATPAHFVVFVAPRHLHLAPLVAGQRPFIQNLRWEPERGTEVVVVSRREPGRQVRFVVPAFFLWHVVNAWEEGEEIVVDYVRYDDDQTDRWFGRAPWEIEPVPASSLRRARIHPEKRGFSETVLSDRAQEFVSVAPRDNGRPARTTWGLSWDEARARSGGPPEITRTHLENGAVDVVELGPDTYPSEPMVVEDVHGQDWVLSLVYDGASDTSHVVVVDAARPREGAVAKLWFDHAIPFTLHGAWVGG